MGTTIYWAIRHMQQVKQGCQFRAKCWWLRQEVEFVEWRLHYGMTSQPPCRTPLLATEAGRQGLAVHAGTA